jgi:transposase
LLKRPQLNALFRAGRELLTTKNLGGRPHKFELSDIDRVVEDYREEYGDFPTKERVAELANVTTQTISNILEREGKGTYTAYVATAPMRAKRSRTFTR